MIPDNKNTMRPWEKNFLGVPFSQVPRLLPGLAAGSLLSWLSIWLANAIGVDLLGFPKSPISPVMIVIILGLILASSVKIPPLFDPGLRFSVKKLLRLGIILLGIRLTIFDVFKLGASGVPIVLACILGALMITTWINKKLDLPRRLGTLIAVGTSICGVTAIVATSPVIDANEEESAYAVAVITVFGLFATLFYPALAQVLFAGNALESGLFLGTAVHETAQVVGAAKIYSDMYHQAAVLDIATVTKLVRNVFMTLVIPYLAFTHARQSSRAASPGSGRPTLKALFPKFILGFLALAVARSIGDAGIQSAGSAFGLLNQTTWEILISVIKSWAEILLVVALAGVGMGTSFSSLKALGIRPFLVGLGASLSVGIVSYLAIQILGGWVAF